MKKLLLFFLFFPLLLDAQSTVNKTEAFPVGEQVEVAGILPEPGSNNLMVVYKEYGGKGLGTVFNDYGNLTPTIKVKWAVDIFSSDLKRITTGKLGKIERADGDDLQFGETSTFGGFPSMLFHRYEKKNKRTLVYRAKVEAGGKIGALTELGSLSGDADKYARPVITYSVDSAYLLLLSPYTGDRMEESPEYLILDRSWTVIKKGTLNLTGDQETWYLLGLPVIGTDASIWMPVWTLVKRKEETGQEVWHWQEPTDKPQRIDVGIATDRLVTDMRLQQSATDQAMYVGGTYAAASKKAHKAIFSPPFAPEDFHPVQGTFMAKLDLKSGAVLVKSARPFRAATLQYWNKDAQDLQKGDGIDLIRPVGVHPQSDGSVWIEAEEFVWPPLKISGTTGALNTGGFPRYGPALAIFYVAGGEVSQEIVVGKRSWAYLHRHGSHFFTADNQGITFLYNDHDENIDTPPARAKDLKINSLPDGPGGWIQKQACVTLYTARNNGAGKPECLFKSRETNYWLDPATFLQTAPSAYIFAGEGKDGQFGLMKVTW